MLSLALAATLIGFVLLILGLITGTVWLAITCIIVCLLGLAFLITDIVGSGRRADDDADSGSFAGIGSFDRDARDPDSRDPDLREPDARRSGTYDSGPFSSSDGPNTGSGPLTATAADGTRRLLKQDPPTVQQGRPTAPAPGRAAAPETDGPRGQEPPRLDRSGQFRTGQTPAGQVPRPAAAGVEGGYDDYLRSIGGVPEPGPHTQSGPAPQSGPNPQSGSNAFGGQRGPRPGVEQQRYAPGPRPQQVPGQVGQQPRAGQQPPQVRPGPAQGFGPGQGRPPAPGQPPAQGQQPPRGPQMPTRPVQGPPQGNRPAPSAPNSGQGPAQDSPQGSGTGTGRRRKIDPLDPEWRPGS